MDFIIECFRTGYRGAVACAVIIIVVCSAAGVGMLWLSWITGASDPLGFMHWGLRAPLAVLSIGIAGGITKLGEAILDRTD